MEKNQAERYIESLVNKSLRIHTTDKRLFVGSLCCTDNERNIILSNTYEHRYPSPTTLNRENLQEDPTAENDTAKMISRLIGLVVVPGQHITKIEVAESSDRNRII